MSACTPAASNACLRNLGSSALQRCELLVSGRMTPTLPGAAAPPLLPEPLLPLSSPPQAATLPTAIRPTAARANIPLRIRVSFQVNPGHKSDWVRCRECRSPRRALDQELLLWPATYSGSGL